MESEDREGREGRGRTKGFGTRAGRRATRRATRRAGRRGSRRGRLNLTFKKKEKRRKAHIVGNTAIKGELESSRRFQRVSGGLQAFGRPLEGMQERQEWKEGNKEGKKEGKKERQERQRREERPTSWA